MSSNYLMSSNLKTALHSKHANIYYLEKRRVQVSGGRMEYAISEDKEPYYWDIPVTNTTALMLGIGTSVTQATMHEFIHAEVMVDFYGASGTPLYSANEVDVDVSWLSLQSEYHPTEYLQQWVSFWFAEDKRLAAVKCFQLVRLTHIDKHWSGSKMLREHALQPDVNTLHALLNRTCEGTDVAESHVQLILIEAKLTKALYKMVSQTVGYGDFTCARRGDDIDVANRFLDQRNYPAYGLAAVAVWITGILHGLAVMHGKTRRDGLVSDLADLIKDVLAMPQAFITVIAGEDTQELRQRFINIFWQTDAPDVMVASPRETAQALAEANQWMS